MGKKKRPAIMFYTGDWMKDPHLGQCSPGTRGIWMDLLCAMHEAQDAKLMGTAASLSRICRCTAEEMQEALKELAITQTANVTFSNDRVTIICRRMEKEFKERDGNVLRVKKHREKRSSNENVMTPSSVSVSSSVSLPDQEEGIDPILDCGFVPSGKLEKDIEQHGKEVVEKAVRITAEKAENPGEGFYMAVLRKEVGRKRLKPETRLATGSSILVAVKCPKCDLIIANQSVKRNGMGDKELFCSNCDHAWDYKPGMEVA